MRKSLRRLFRISNPPARPPKARSGKGWNRRFRMMLRHTWLIATAGILLCAGLGAVAFYFATLPTVLKIAVGPPNSEDLRVVQAISQQLARDRASVRLRPLIKDGGTRETATAIDTGEADLAVVRRDIAMPREGQAVAILRKNVAVLIIPEPEQAKGKPVKPATGKNAKAAKAKTEKGKIEKIGDLVGKRVGIVGRSQSNLELLKVVLRQYNISPDKVVMLSSDAESKPNAADKISIVQFDPNTVSSAIRDAKVDAILSVGPVSSPITADAIAAATRGKEPPTFLAIDAAEAIAERNPIYEATEIKAGAFGGSPPRPEESVDTIGVHHYIVARRKLSEDTVADFTRLLFNIRQSLAAEMLSAAKIEAPDTDKDAAVPVHPGAAAYIDGEMKTFFDRYNDLLYWGLMVFSFFGSALAGLASYTKSDDRSRRLRVLEQLLEITKSARTAETIQGGNHSATRRAAGRNRQDPGRHDLRRGRQHARRGGVVRILDLARPGATGAVRPARDAARPADAGPPGGCVAVISRYIRRNPRALARGRHFKKAA
jgi:TRAP-type uncharacterized transport system substrate-binding protein